MKEKKLITRSGTIFYLCSECFLKQHKTLVFLYGLTADHTLLDKQTEAFEAEYNIIVWDAPAHGKSRSYKTSPIQTRQTTCISSSLKTA